MNEPWAIESILNGTGGGGGGGNPIPPITNIYVPVEAWQYQDRIIDVVGFPWVADVPYPNVKASDFVSVIFYQEDAESGIFSNVCDSRTDAVRIFASEKPSKRIRIDTLSGYRPNASNSIWGHITGDIQTQQDLIDFVGESNKIEMIKANGTELTITDKAVNIPLATNSSAGLTYLGNDIYTVYVSPNGDDTTGDGTQVKPWRNIQKAINMTGDIINARVRINCSAGEYNGNVIFNRNHSYLLNTNGGDVQINGSMRLQAESVVFSSSSPGSLISINTTDDTGILIENGCSFYTRSINLLITASVYGIRMYGQSGESIGELGKSVIRLNNTTTINLTSPSATGISCGFAFSIMGISKLIVNATSGFAISLVSIPTMALIHSLTTTITQYKVESGSMLAIGGKLVDQT